MSKSYRNGVEETVIELFKTAMLVGAILIGTTLGIGTINDMGKDVYRGEVSGNEVVYSEGKFRISPKSEFTESRLVVKIGDTTYILTDIYDEIGIDWKADVKPNFERDELEEIVIQEEDSTKTYSCSEIDETTIDGKHTKTICEKGNSLYNGLRDEIREELRAEHLEALSEIESDFPK